LTQALEVLTDAAAKVISLSFVELSDRRTDGQVV